MTLGDFKGANLEKLIAAKVETRLETVGVLLVNELKQELVARDNPGIPGKDGRVRSNPAGAAPPGEPPAKYQGRLSGSVTYALDKAKLSLKVGSNVVYALVQEFNHPWLRPVFRKNMGQIGKIVGGK